MAGADGSGPLSEFHTVSPADFVDREIPDREWVIDNLIPRGEVTILAGDGGVGKSLLSIQIMCVVATGHRFLDLDTMTGEAIGLFAEDDQWELMRRTKRVCGTLGIDQAQTSGVHYASRVGEDNALMRFKANNEGEKTPLFHQLERKIADIRPMIVFIDNAAQTFAGGEIIRAQVTAYCNALARIAKSKNCAVVLLAHPSLEGMRSKRGDSGSTAWSNSVRHRLYFERPETEEGDDDDFDARILSTKKTNYGQLGAGAPLRWCDGAFILDEEQGAAEPDEKVEDAIVGGLTALLERGTPNSASRNQTSYAPKELCRNFPDCRRFGSKRVEAIFERMVGERRIEIESRSTSVGRRKFAVPREPERLDFENGR